MKTSENKTYEHMSLSKLREYSEDLKIRSKKSLNEIINRAPTCVQEEIENRLHASDAYSEQIREDYENLASKWSDDTREALTESYGLESLYRDGKFKVWVENTLKVSPNRILVGLNEDQELIIIENKKVLTAEQFVEAVKGDKVEYQKFFKKALKKFGVTEPDQLEGKKKKEFFDYVDKNWEADNEADESCDDDVSEAKDIPTSNIAKFTSPNAAKKAASEQKYKVQVFMGDDKKFWVPSTNKEAGLLKKAGYEVYEETEDVSESVINFKDPSSKQFYIKANKLQLANDTVYAGKGNTTSIIVSSTFVQKHDPNSDDLVDYVQEDTNYLENLDELEALRLYAKAKIYKEDITVNEFAEFLMNYDGELNASDIVNAMMESYKEDIITEGFGKEIPVTMDDLKKGKEFKSAEVTIRSGDIVNITKGGSFKAKGGSFYVDKIYKFEGSYYFVNKSGDIKDRRDIIS